MTAPEVVATLERAGRTLLAMGLRGHSLGMRSWWPDVVHDRADAYGWTGEQVRAPVPEPRVISEMDEAYRWVEMIDSPVRRRIVLARSLVNPVTERHLYSWRRIGQRLGCDHKAAQLWHRQGIEMIVSGLARRVRMKNSLAQTPQNLPLLSA